MPPRPAYERGCLRCAALLSAPFQYVCVVSRLGDFEQAAWHRRKAPTNWVDEPPFHMRIVRPTPAGILHYMLTTGKAELQKVVREKGTNRQVYRVPLRRPGRGGYRGVLVFFSPMSQKSHMKGYVVVSGFLERMTLDPCCRGHYFLNVLWLFVPVFFFFNVSICILLYFRITHIFDGTTSNRCLSLTSSLRRGRANALLSLVRTCLFRNCFSRSIGTGPLQRREELSGVVALVGDAR